MSALLVSARSRVQDPVLLSSNEFAVLRSRREMAALRPVLVLLAFSALAFAATPPLCSWTATDKTTYDLSGLTLATGYGMALLFAKPLKSRLW